MGEAELAESPRPVLAIRWLTTLLGGWFATSESRTPWCPPFFSASRLSCKAWLSRGFRSSSAAEERSSLNSFTERRASLTNRPKSRAMPGSLPGPKTTSSSSPITTISWAPIPNTSLETFRAGVHAVSLVFRAGVGYASNPHEDRMGRCESRGHWLHPSLRFRGTGRS